MNEAPKLYVEDTRHTYQPKRLGDQAYAEALQCFVVVCTDACIIDPNGSIFLARRRSRPASGWWWFIGGRMMIGETEQTSVARCFLRETKVGVDPNRFKFLCMNHYHFRDRAQPPIEVGCASLCFTMTIELTKNELDAVRLDPTEYLDGGLREFTRADLEVRADGVTDIVRDVYRKVFRR